MWPDDVWSSQLWEHNRQLHFVLLGSGNRQNLLGCKRYSPDLYRLVYCSFQIGGNKIITSIRNDLLVENAEKFQCHLNLFALFFNTQSWRATVIQLPILRVFRWQTPPCLPALSAVVVRTHGWLPCTTSGQSTNWTMETASWRWTAPSVDG